MSAPQSPAVATFSREDDVRTTTHLMSRAFKRLWDTMLVLVINEIRLRTRRLSTLFAVLAMMALSWSMIVDPSTGMSLIVVNQTRVLYTSSALAMGSAGLLSFLMALIGFYLVRGRMSEDIRSGIGCVIASTGVSNGLFLFSRWLGGVAYMMLLALAAMLAILALHALRGDESIRIAIYLQTYALILGPMIFFAVSVAILFDSVPMLMGKAGDVIYFFLWVMQISLIAKIAAEGNGAWSNWFLFDFSGMVTSVSILENHLGIHQFSLGASEFKSHLTPISLPVVLWSMKIAAMRLATSFIAILPLLPAFFLFHRFSPDRVKQSQSRKRRSPLDILNAWTRPLARQVHPLFAWAARLPSFAGQTLSELALCLVNAPSSLVAIVIVTAFSSLMNLRDLHSILLPAIAFWGVLISDISTRDYQAGILPMTGVAQGGSAGRYFRQFSAAAALGLLFVAVVLLRLSFSAPLMALSLIVGILGFAALATFLGAVTHTSRTFLCLFLFWLYVASQATQVPILDAVGFNQAIDLAAIFRHAQIGGAALLLGFLALRWRKE